MRDWRGVAMHVVVPGAAVGFLLGLVIGIYVMPVRYTDTDIGNLQTAQKDDWVAMVSDAYALDHNLDDARQRIYRLDGDPAAAVRYVAEVAQRAIDRNGPTARNIAELAIALGAGTPAIRSYLQSNPTLAPAQQ